MLYIGVDLGTSAVKLLLMDESGKVLNIVSKEYPISFPKPGCSHQSHGFCSDQPGFGNEIGYSFETVFTTVPCLSISRSFTEEVPKSTPI